MSTNLHPVSTERDVQNRIIDSLQDHLGFDYIGNLHDVENDDIREDSLRKFLKESQNCTDEQAAEAIRKLRNEISCPNTTYLYNANKNVYSLLRYGTSVSQGLGKPNRMVQFIDWEHKQDNIFELAEEVTVRRQTISVSHRRPDVVLYVNGIAMVVLELKKAVVSVAEGINQNWRNQQTDDEEDGNIPQFFVTPQLLLAGNESEGLYYGTTLTPPKFWLKWKEPAGTGYASAKTDIPIDYSTYSPREFPNELERSLLQMLQPTRLLEFIHDCVIFDGGIKKVARPNQYFALNVAKIRAKHKESGIIWHSQGSGKSLTMIWLAQWIKENIDDSRIVVITDRDELDKQIENVFRSTGESSILRVKSRKELISALNGSLVDSNGNAKPTPSIICTLIHKFGVRNDNDPDVNDEFNTKVKVKKTPEQIMQEIADSLPQGFKAKGNLYVFVDECHRSQGGILNKAMKKIMGDDVMLVGFTGTPLLKDDKGRLTSRDNFGPWIHTYKFDEAVADKVILDLRYESRNVEQELSDSARLDNLFENKTVKLTQKAKEALQDRWARMQNLFSSRDRINKIVTNVLYDFDLIPALRDGWGNAMLVADSIYQAYRYWDAFSQNGLAGHCAVVSSYDGVEPDLSAYSGSLKTEEQFKYEANKRMLAGRSPEDFEEMVKKDFVNSPGKMKLLIVVDKLLTGFDAPAATYLYIDKKMQDHNLFQSICRVNRVNGENKEYGYIIDYKQLFEEIEGAIQDYTNGAFSKYDKEDVNGLLKNRIVEGKKDLDAAVERCDRLSEPVALPKSIDDFFDYFCYNQQEGTEEDHQAEIIRNAQKREEFYEACYSLVRRYSALALLMSEAGYTQEQAKEIHDKAKSYDEVRSAIARRCGDYFDIRQYDAEMRALLDNYVSSPRVEKLEELKDFSFLDIIKINSETGEVTTDKQAESQLGGQKGVAETLAANVRRVINRKRESNPEEYKYFSEKLNRLLEEYQQETLEYKELLKLIKELSEEFKNQQMVDPRIDTEGKKALYDNLGKDVELAVKVHKVVAENAVHGFRQSSMRKRNLLNKIRESLEGTPFDAEEILNIVVNNTEFGN